MQAVSITSTIRSEIVGRAAVHDGRMYVSELALERDRKV